MSTSSDRPRWTIAFAAVGALVLLAAGAGMAGAEEPDLTSQIVNALKPKPVLTRGLSGSSAAVVEQTASPESQRLLDSLRRKRGLERVEIEAVSRNKPSVDLEVYFDYRSSEIGERAMPTIMALGRALSSPELKGGVFLLAGHTDAVGSPSYNQKLSQRRAEAIKQALTKNFSLSPETLLTVGYGKDKLKNGQDPFAAENRRVQIVNLEAKKAGTP